MILTEVEKVVADIVKRHSDKIVDVLALKITEAIPSAIDDAVVAALLPKLKEELKNTYLSKLQKLTVNKWLF